MKLSTGAAICLILDIIAFIISSAAFFTTSNVFFACLLATLIVAFAFDAYKATAFLINHHFKNKK